MPNFINYLVCSVLAKKYTLNFARNRDLQSLQSLQSCLNGLIILLLKKRCVIVLS